MGPRGKKQVANLATLQTTPKYYQNAQDKQGGLEKIKAMVYYLGNFGSGFATYFWDRLLLQNGLLPGK